MSMGNPGNPGRDGHESPAIQPSHVCWQSFCVEISTFSIWNSLKTHLWSNKLHQISSTKLQKLSKNTWKHLQIGPTEDSSAVLHAQALRRLAAGAARRPGRSVMGSAVSSDSEKVGQLGCQLVLGDGRGWLFWFCSFFFGIFLHVKYC